MPWLIALNVAIYGGSLYLLIKDEPVWALICFLFAGLVSLILSGGKFNPFDLID